MDIFDIMLQGVVVGRGPDSLRIEALIQHKPKENFPVVQEKTVVFNMDFPHARIGFHRDPTPSRPRP